MARPTPPKMPYMMIVVRRHRSNLLPHQKIPMPYTIAITIAPIVTSLALNPCSTHRDTRHLVGVEALQQPLRLAERRVVLGELKDRLAEPQPDRGVDGDPGR